MTRRQRVTLLLCLILLPVEFVTADDQQKAVSLEVTVPVRMQYLVYTPPGYEADDLRERTWPLLLFLHGAGERGDDIELVKFHGPPKLINQGQPFPFVVVSPQCPKDRWWEPIELMALLDEIEANYRIDADQIYVTGLSMGGFGTWELAAYAPDRFAAIVPICGGGEEFWMKRFTHVPTWIIHGGQDSGVLPERSQELYDELQDRGGNVRLTIAPQTGHLVWTSFYDNPELYGWLLQQKRKAREAGDP
ncbi:MAG: prolyl oligopeptidase family serine peptidase [Planctomycetaceae bacterium]|nr:prolyl oligopeptidase family serine peptidase [Planctomycetaceae bacterium]